MEAFDSLVIPKLDEFKPQFLIVSAGFDAAIEDPLADELLRGKFEDVDTIHVEVVIDENEKDEDGDPKKKLAFTGSVSVPQSDEPVSAAASEGE